jgi:metal-responsive CopG/Arc/MetJ family transcriptional regulator
MAKRYEFVGAHLEEHDFVEFEECRKKRDMSRNKFVKVAVRAYIAYIRTIKKIEEDLEVEDEIVSRIKRS